MVDKSYALRRQKALDAGLLWGAYHFADGSDPKEQFDHFLETAEPDENTLMCLDWEPYKSVMSLKSARTFLEYGADKLGRKLVLYSGNQAKEQLGKKKDEFFGSHRLWLCQYGPKPVCQASWDKPWLWQFTDGKLGPVPHKIDGIDGSGIDINSFDGTVEELKTSWAS